MKTFKNAFFHGLSKKATCLRGRGRGRGRSAENIKNFTIYNIIIL